MLGRIIKTNKECVTLHSINSFKKVVKDHYKSEYTEFDEKNRGMLIGSRADKAKLYKWNRIASDLEWFDGASVVTDNNENYKVMTWLNV